jgi:lysophospholipase L1-like esterase
MRIEQKLPAFTLWGIALTVGVMGSLAIAAAAAGPATTQALPKVVLLGDSIREGYAPIVAELLAGKATVVTPKVNGGDTAKLLKNLDEWAIRERPDVVHFNCGIHDTKQSKQTAQNQVPPEQYEANLREIVKRLREQTPAKIVFALSTPIMDERAKPMWETRSYRLINASITEYNRIALRVMKELDVPVDDLPAAVGDADELARLLDAGGVHYTPEGRRKLAEAVTSLVVQYLPNAAPTTAQSMP